MEEVKMGQQVWMKRNLDVDKFRNGDPIPQAKTDAEWEQAGEQGMPAWCYYENNSTKGAQYGKLYNWYAVNESRGLAPKGWHIPSEKEWDELVEYLGGEEEAGEKLPQTDECIDIFNGTMGSGFSCFASGFRFNSGQFSCIGLIAILWSSNEDTTEKACSLIIECFYGGIERDCASKGSGFAIRCILD